MVGFRTQHDEPRETGYSRDSNLQEIGIYQSGININESSDLYNDVDGSDAYTVRTGQSTH